MLGIPTGKHIGLRLGFGREGKDWAELLSQRSATGIRGIIDKQLTGAYDGRFLVKLKFRQDIRKPRFNITSRGFYSYVLGGCY